MYPCFTNGARLKRRGLLVVAGLVFVAAVVHADTLILRNGQRIDGQLMSVQNGVVEFRKAGFFGEVGRINRDDVAGIEFGRAERNDRDRDRDRDWGRDRDRDSDRSGQYPEPRPRGLREKQVMVVANAAWSDTGVEVRSGQTIYVEAMGEIRWGPSRRAGPGGELNSPYNAARPMPNRPGGSLIGRVGNGDSFFVGDDHGATRVRDSGRLFLGINDDYLQDNTGYFRVTVYY